ncbi:hypothetical protein PRVXT_000253 [Proteinivorax tanatarense]|uniref:DUF4365 domain-containing protein n=1 Tax=Proteinivorax tanatarense TaxID=1260629 RepID=A0AAU7VMT0_9FIRM
MSSKTEEKAIRCVEDVVDKSKLLKSLLDKNDKTPSWDGEIYVYNTSNHRKDNLKGKVPVQVKGTNVKKFSAKTKSFPIQVSDLLNYFHEGGILFFVVEINKRLETKIFYICLLPLDIKTLLAKAMEGQKSISGKLTYLAKSSKLQNICRSFLHNRKLQYSTVRQGDKNRELEEFNIIDFTVFVDDKTTISDHVLNNEIYLYGRECEESIPTPLGKSKAEQISYQIDSNISVDSVVYFESCKMVKSKNKDFIVVNENINFNINDNIMHFNSKGNLSTRLKETEFIINVIKNGYFCVEEARFEVLNIPGKKRVAIQQYYSNLLKTEKVLNLYNIKEDLEMDSLTNKDYKNLNIFIDININKRKIKSKLSRSNFSLIKIGNIHIAIFILVDINRYMNIINLFGNKEKLPKCIYTYNECEYEGCIYTLLTTDYILKANNLNLQIVKESIKSAPFSEQHRRAVTQLVLNLITAYDLDNNFKESISLALEICRWLEHHDNIDTVTKLNKYQILKRMRGLYTSEKHELLGLREIEKDKPVVLCGINILLDNKTDFEYYFDKLTTEEREEFKRYPISNISNLQK